MKSWVLDASVAAKWYLAGEPLTKEAIGVLESFGAGQLALHVPDLFWPELGNILWTAVRHGRIAATDARHAIASISSGSIQTDPSRPLLEKAFAIAQAWQQTVYDATYVALAVEQKRNLLTADERLANALRAHYPVQWLGALSSADRV
ncbi:MAG TPA: type II toxin-antitoxin system VapC family toxin [Bryobacteraceae bacterium]|nr:type II toxin-antitoxin system VapC family toxin [Bryobacteraceae bacterium]